MSLERVINALVYLGLSRMEAEVYVYLTKENPKGIGNLEKSLKYANKELRFCLKNLQDVGIVTAKMEKQIVFSALPFEEALDLLIKMKKKQTQVMQKKENRDIL